MFDIRFISRVRGRRPIASGESTGAITLGNFTERFRADLSYWNATQYENQWRQGVARIVQGREASALITSVADPAASDALMWWPLYRSGREVYVRNGILFFAQLATPFNIDNPYTAIPERRYSSSKDEYSISEWSIGVEDLRAFLSQHR